MARHRPAPATPTASSRLTNSTNGQADGVYGKAAATTGGANGVTGLTNAPSGYGVWGIAASTDTSGFSYGVYGTSGKRYWRIRQCPVLVGLCRRRGCLQRQHL